ncbi:hypothetical protein NW754_000877 [Fusarium falciforme]|uniref:Uncharacterized protein n=1 Tax=Fusarium falciforme TaxID=195108 RepID=A0A9W8V0R2_9HYPO|nr:hypothetical protein NW754_000877 [Fusarium falciforme]KAJ4189666.1 hypothetical protein NW755_005669 [Fusarium falciforme]KAJ4210022.1 hypothetical protein NW767_000300 [Fusarium falciforme]
MTIEKASSWRIATKRHVNTWRWRCNVKHSQQSGFRQASTNKAEEGNLSGGGISRRREEVACCQQSTHKGDARHPPCMCICEVLPAGSRSTTPDETGGRGGFERATNNSRGASDGTNGSCVYHRGWRDNMEAVVRSI